MPLYDYKCEACGYEAEHINKVSKRNEQRCDRCNEYMSIFIGNTLGKYIPFKEGWYEHIAANPIYISSMKQLRHECKKRDMTSVYAEDR